MNNKYAEILKRHQNKEILKNYSLFDYRKELESTSSTESEEVQEQQEDGNEKLESIYDKIYAEADKHLQSQAEALGFPESFLIFDQDDYRNGISNVTPEVVAGMSFRVVSEHYHAYSFREQDIQENCSSEIIKHIKESEVSVEQALVEYNALTIYHHEFGHLFQRRAEMSTGISIPEPQQEAGEIAWKHANEIDCDWMAMDGIAQRINANFRDAEGNWNRSDVEQVQAEVSIALCSLICYMENAGKSEQAKMDADDIELYKTVYPHPYARLEHMKLSLVAQLRKYLPAEIVLDDNKMIKDAYDLADAMTNDFGNPVCTMQSIVQRNQQKIDDYVKKVLAKIETMPESCYNHFRN